MSVIGHGVEVCTSTTRPTNPPVGLQIYQTDTNTLHYYTGTYWDTSTPAGAVMFFARSTAPEGWLKANGALINRSTYSNLFAAIGTSYGSGDGSTTFALPDYRGEFMRAWDDGRSVDSGRSINTFQGQDWKGFYQTNTGQNTFSYSHGPVYMGKGIYGINGWTGNLFTGYWAAPAAAVGTLWDSSEIRPRNVALLACIKF